MTLNEAIEELDNSEFRIKTEQDRKKYIATRLGVQALKGIMAIRCGAISDVSQPLPGETAG